MSLRMQVGFIRVLMPWSHLLFGYWRGTLFGFGGNQPRTLMREWLGYVRNGSIVSDGAQRFDADAAMRAVEVPVFALVMRGDSYVPEPGARHLAAKTRGPFELHTLDRLDDGTVPDHFNWVKAPDAVARILAARVRGAPVA